MCFCPFFLYSCIDGTVLEISTNDYGEYNHLLVNSTENGRSNQYRKSKTVPDGMIFFFCLNKNTNVFKVKGSVYENSW